jgi:hypothetical protein
MKYAHNVLLLLSWLVCCFASGMIINYTYYQVMPITHWVNYETVKPLKQVVKVGQPLEFVSKKDTHRRCDLTFNDILYCRNGQPDNYRYYASQDSGHINCMSEAGQALQWRFRHRVTEPTECYLQSNITLHLPWGIKKHQTIEGDIFRVVP